MDPLIALLLGVHHVKMTQKVKQISNNEFSSHHGINFTMEC